MTRRELAIAARYGLGAAGAAAVAALVLDAGPDRVARALAAAGPWLPFVVAGEVAIVATDVMAVRSIHGRAGERVPLGVWMRSAALALVAASVLPAGRVVGEAARAGELASSLGAPRAIAGASSMQGAFLWGTALAALVCLGGVVAGPVASSPLAVLLACGAGWNALLGSVLLLGSRIQLGARLARVVPARWSALVGARLGALDSAARELPAIPTGAVAWTFGGRALQVAQCGAALAAVAGAERCGVRHALVADAIQLVASNLGDAVPGQAGVLEGAFRVFAAELPLGTLPQALALALVLRASRLGVAGVGALAWARWRTRDDWSGLDA